MVYDPRESLRGMPRFKETWTEMLAQTATNGIDHQATIADVLTGYAGSKAINTEHGIVKLSSNAEQQLFRKIKLPVATLNAFDGHPDLQRQMALVKMEDAGVGDEKVIMRGRQVDDTMIYDAVLSDQYSPVPNGLVIMGLADTLPQDAVVHKARIHNRQLWLRIVSPEWYHDLGGGGMAMTGLIIRNDEIGQSVFSIRVGIARVSCWNYTMAEHPIWEHDHRFIGPKEVGDNLNKAIGRLDEVGSEIANRLNHYQEVPIEDAALMIKAMAVEMKLPGYAIKDAQDWYTANGAIPTLFWAVQAVSHGVATMTGGKRSQWDRREEAEWQVMGLADSFSEDGVLKLHECSKCHRPLEVYGETIEAEAYEVN